MLSRIALEVCEDRLLLLGSERRLIGLSDLCLHHRHLRVPHQRGH
jgi:hypothetical protein